jgi:hypothetical protein
MSQNHKNRMEELTLINDSKNKEIKINELEKQIEELKKTK